MFIPKYWKHIAKTVEGIDMTKCKRHWNRGNEAYISSWGYSNASEDDALRKAHERFAETVEALQNPQDNNLYYPHAVIKEDIIEIIEDKKGKAIITRNRYGALVLNTEQLMFIDIDTPEMIKGEPGFLQKLFGKKFVWKRLSTEGKRVFEDGKMKEVESFCHAHPEFGCKVYKTFAGLRLIATHKSYAADSEETQKIFDALGCDPLYQKLCQSQKCFRARLTPKRWRMNEGEVLNKPELTFRIAKEMIEDWQPSDEKRLKQYEQWTQVYDQSAKNYATCQFVQLLGNADIDAELKELIELHDRYTNANEEKTLA